MSPLSRFVQVLCTAQTFLFLIVPGAHAWVYPEHRDIAVLAIQELDPDRRAVLEQLWRTARTGYESRLCEIVADPAQGTSPHCLDYASWPAIAGDHSCSSADMLRNILDSEWILDVAGVAAELKENLAGVTERHVRINDLRTSDIQLQRADPEYATRAGSNNAHFLIARHDVVVDEHEYANNCLRAGSEMNGLGIYSWYHITAMYKASLFNKASLSEEERSQLALSILADEAFALHFLEDTFAAGHVAGTWGDASLRKGTHDYYNENGIEESTWGGESMILLGDAYMRPEDAERAARSVRRSLEHLLDAVSGKEGARLLDLGYPSHLPEGLNVCAVNTMPDFRNIAERDVTLITQSLTDVMSTTPVPGLASGKGELPRFRAELGPFIGVVPAVGSNVISGGYGEGQKNAGIVNTIEAAVRLGLGLDGVMNESGDGLVFLDIGYRQDASSSTSFVDFEELDQFGSLTSAIPARTAMTARLRLPFWLIPGDMLILGPIMYFISPKALTNMAVQAGNGGLIPWQSGIATSIGRFQFVLGREVSVAFFGHTRRQDDRFFLATEDDILIIGMQSLYFDFPILEYRPFRTFSLTQSSSLAIQLTAGFDIPTHVQVISSEFQGRDPSTVPVPELNTIWHFGVRVAFDWRSYFQ
ncbi:MAG: hypothetical protein OEV30_01730 [Ignavibacteria bacterium]|nr:hypothetical protein [Ignavibacteria bacterium]